MGEGGQGGRMPEEQGAGAEAVRDAERWKSGERCKTLFFPFFQKQEPRMLLDLCLASFETSEPMNKLKAH